MIKEAFGTGATIQEAQDAAVKELNAPIGIDVQIELVESPSKKVLGLFGGSPAKVRAWYECEENAYEKADAYIRSILSGLGIDECEIDFVPDEDNVLRVNVSCGDDYGIVIGRRGETLDAIQYLTRLVVNKGDGEYKRISLNVGNYREKRETSLQNVAKRTAEKVKKYGRRETLEPMNPYERRIIHTTIQSIEGVTSRSVGVDAGRRVVIELEKGVKPLRGNRGGYNRNNSAKTTAEPKEHRSDAQGASLYGKIEPKAKTEE